MARTAVLVVTGCAFVGLGSGAAYAEPRGNGPSANASCVGQVFVPQATAEPGDVAEQIAFLKEFVLPVVGVNFGTAISDNLARVPKAECFG